MLFPFTVIFFQLCKVKQFFPHSQIFLAKTLNFDDKYAKRVQNPCSAPLL